MSEGEFNVPPKTETRAQGEEFKKTVRDAFRQGAQLFGPPETAVNHFRQARKEILLGFRELIDARLERLSRQETKGTRVVVE